MMMMMMKWKVLTFVYCTFDGPQTGRFEARLLNLTSNKRLGVGARV